MPHEIIDVHTHCFAGPGCADTVARGLARLERAGVRHTVVVGCVNTLLDEEGCRGLIPREVEQRGRPDFYEVDDLLGFARIHAPMVIPFIDTRHLWGGVVPLRLAKLVSLGFRGLKGIYLPDGDNDIGVAGGPATLGISLSEYRRREWEIFAFAEAHGLPLLYHMDAKRHGDVMEALLADFPRVRVNFAHFGIGRTAFRPVLELHSNVWTDLSSLLPHARRRPDGYRQFILDHPDRVCFGTDTFLYALDGTLDYIDLVRSLALPPEVERAVFWDNPRRFLGTALPESDRQTTHPLSQSDEEA